MPTCTTSLAYIPAPLSNIFGTIKIAIPCPATSRVDTGKPFLLARTEMQTGMAHLGRVGRRHQQEHDACQCGFILHELPQLVEGPTVRAAAFPLRSGLLVCALPNAGKVFQSNSNLFGVCSLDEMFGDTVIGMPLKVLFTPRQPCQKLT